MSLEAFVENVEKNRTRSFEWDDVQPHRGGAQRHRGHLLDSAMGCAVHSTLAAAVGYTTTDLQARYVRGMGLDTGHVRAEASVVHAGRRLVTAQGQIIAVGSGKFPL